MMYTWELLDKNFTESEEAFHIWSIGKKASANGPDAKVHCHWPY